MRVKAFLLFSVFCASHGWPLQKPPKLCSYPTGQLVMVPVGRMPAPTLLDVLLGRYPPSPWNPYWPPGLNDPYNNWPPGLNNPYNPYNIWPPGLNNPYNNWPPGPNDPYNNWPPGPNDPYNNWPPGPYDPYNNWPPGPNDPYNNWPPMYPDLPYLPPWFGDEPYNGNYPNGPCK
ncbi:sporozoite surface protein 2-like isoform X3 [Penaeus japonicus]|uniref:sporozoite surface protein 2-like isoform X3 n=1 Tax=Penaeus japonicus TaxID=27405 RepID=UPI001C717274|nr:sporozoite surface protein 2-like isoform X3 [Penaeus japonicus]XP_042891353.1 sporozoite surface protein 2-like isoform X3 [Penaeus japonicus]